MEKLLMCRICLATDLRMDCIVNTHLQDTYERLTMKQFETKDSRPILACYLCCARLQNCYQLSMNCLQSEEILTQMLSSNMLNPKNLQEITRTMRLGTTPVIVETFGDALLDAMDGRVKVEPSTQTSGIEVEVKMVVNEVVGDRIPEERIKEEPTIGDSFQGADPEDDIPLDIVKHEPGIITPGASVDKKSSAAMQKEKIEDTSLNRFNKNKQVHTNFKRSIKNIKKTTMDRGPVEKYTLSTCKIDDVSMKSKCASYICDTCQKCFSRKQHLVRHIQIHTGKKPHKCNACNKSFIYKTNLKNHYRVHTGETPYSCSLCSKRFRCSSNMKNHLRSHTGDRKIYTCDVCQIYTTVHRQQIVRHLQIHANDRPFKCDVCNKCCIS